MSSVEEHSDVDEGSDDMLRFVMTLIVATLIAAVTFYVLSYAVLTPERAASTHAAIQHERL